MLADCGKKSEYFRNLLNSAQVRYLEQVRQSLEVPVPKPTPEQIEEAENAERG